MKKLILSDGKLISSHPGLGSREVLNTTNMQSLRDCPVRDSMLVENEKQRK